MIPRSVSMETCVHRRFALPRCSTTSCRDVFEWNRKVLASERTQQLEMICLRGKRQKRQMMMLFIRFDDTTTAVCHSGRNGAPVPSGQSPKGLGSFHQGSAKESGTVEETRRGMSTFIFHVNHFLLPPFSAYSCSK